MGATPTKSEKHQYLGVMGYHFTERVPEGHPGSVIRVKADGGAISELLFDDITGIINSVELKVGGPYGNQYLIEVEDESGVVILQINQESRYADTFIARLPNVNPLRPVRITAYSFTPTDGTKKEGINIFQDDHKLNPKFTKDEPN